MSRTRSRTLSAYSTDPQFKKQLASILGTQVEGLAARMLTVEGFDIVYRTGLLLLDLQESRSDVPIFFDWGQYQKSPLVSKRYWNVEADPIRYEKYIERIDFVKKNDRLKAFLEEIEAIFNHNWEKHKEKQLSGWPGSLESGLPDFIAKRKKILYAIEVKTGNAYLLASQVKALEMAEKHHIKPFILHLNVSAKIKEASLLDLKSYPRKRLSH